MYVSHLPHAIQYSSSVVCGVGGASVYNSSHILGMFLICTCSLGICILSMVVCMHTCGVVLIFLRSVHTASPCVFGCAANSKYSILVLLCLLVLEYLLSQNLFASTISIFSLQSPSSISLLLCLFAFLLPSLLRS